MQPDKKHFEVVHFWIHALLSLLRNVENEQRGLEHFAS